MSKNKKVLDKEKFINEYVQNFIELFPNAYTEKELKKILNSKINYIVQDSRLPEKAENKGTMGTYNTTTKVITLVNDTFDSIAFHEITHALCNNINNDSFTLYGDINKAENMYIFAGIDEAFTEYIATLYNNKQNKLGNGRYVKISKNSYYSIGVRVAQQLEMIYQMKNGTSLLDKFIKGEDIRAYIFELFKEELFDSEIEYNQKEIMELAATYTFYYCNLLDRLVAGQNCDNEVVSILQKINKKFYNHQEYKLQDRFKMDFDKVLYHDKISKDAEAKLLVAIFGADAAKDMKMVSTVKDSIEDIMSDYINLIDSGRVK